MLIPPVVSSVKHIASCTVKCVCSSTNCLWFVARFLMTWASFLPFALYNRYQWFTPAVAAVITFLLFGVENIGVQVRSGRARDGKRRDFWA